MQKLTGNRVFLLFGAATLIAFATQLAKIPQGAREYPLVLLIASFLVTVILFVMSQKKEEPIGKEHALRIVVFALIMGLSIFLLTKIGYILSTLLFLYAGLWYLKLKKGVLFFVFPILLTFAMYFLFTLALSVILPMGTWINLAL